MREIKSKELKGGHQYWIIDNIKCNGCGGIVWDSADGWTGNPPYFESVIEWKDKEHEIHLCESCYEGLIKSFIIPVEAR